MRPQTRLQASPNRVRTQQEVEELWTKLAGCVANEQDLVSFERRQLRSKSVPATHLGFSFFLLC